MSEAKHTPGPWYCHPNGYGAYRIKTGQDDTSPTLCSRNYWDSSDSRAEESAANGRLIAAAPDLLEACMALTLN